ncbi:MAG TPA: AMP-binding protein [Candidatus Bathyarchaeia archaeon]|nr:AMP-binding protein [Candidatus Bathyarchaeia archaeon]
MIVADWLARQAAGRPSFPAVIAGGVGVTFAELEHRVALLAGRLRALELGEGVRVAAILHNGLPLVELIHACARHRAPLVLLDPRLTRDEAARQAHRARVKWILAEEATAAAAREAARAAGADLSILAPVGSPGTGEPTLVAPGKQGVPSAAEPPTLDLDSVHTVVFSSGTGGEPRPIALTAGNHLWSALGSAAVLGASRADRWLLCLPIAHVGGLAIVLRGVVLGATVVVEQRFDAAAIADALVHEPISLLSVVPTGLARILDELEGRAPRALRAVLVGGAPASLDLLRRARAQGVPVAPTYGLTEAASQVATLAPDEPLGEAGCVGQPILPTRVRIARADGGGAGPDEDGEIQIAGPTVAPGVLDGEPSHAGGWLATGDVGRVDRAGRLIVIGRADDTIVTGGEKVSPLEVEAVLAGIASLAEVAVAGVPDPDWGQAVAAWVVPCPGTQPSLEELRAACRSTLAPYKLPRRLFVVAELPRTSLGKVKRSALAALARPAQRSSAL